MSDMLQEKEFEIVSKIMSIPLDKWDLETITLDYNGYKVGFEQIGGIIASVRLCLYLLKEGQKKYCIVTDDRITTLFDNIIEYKKNKRDLENKNIIDEIHNDLCGDLHI